MENTNDCFLQKLSSHRSLKQILSLRLLLQLIIIRKIILFHFAIIRSAKLDITLKRLKARSMDTLSTLKENLMHLLELGGSVMLVLMVLSIIGTTVIITKLCQFYSIELFKRSPARIILDNVANQPDQNISYHLEKSRHPVSGVALCILNELKQPKSDPSLGEKEAIRVGNQKLSQMESGLWLLELIATISPLLGLFGTVLGMVDAFYMLQESGSNADPSNLSGGIWQALLTTAAGLIVAIPALVSLKCFERLKSVTSDEMENIASVLLTFKHSHPKKTN